MTEPEGRPPGFIREHSEEQRRQILDDITVLFGRVEDWHTRTRVRIEIQPGSLLADADDLTDPFQISFTVNLLLSNATDHLHALRELFVTAEAQHIYAPYTLIRSALESATRVLYMFREQTPEGAALEALRYEKANLGDQYNAGIAIGMAEEEAEASRQERTDLLNTAIQRSGIRPDRINGSPTSVSTMMRRTRDAYGLGRLPYAMWQMCSAAAHGSRWAIPMLTMLSSDDDAQSPVVVGQIRSDEAFIRNALGAACQVLGGAIAARDAHSRS